MTRTQKPALTVEDVVAIAKRDGEIHVNPLKYDKWRGLKACEKAVKMGLLRRRRYKLDWLIFYPVTETK